jgi:hypothetical protein
MSRTPSVPPIDSPSSTTSRADSAELSAATCTCGSTLVTAWPSKVERGRRLVRLDRAVGTGQVTAAEAAERRVELLAR